MTSNTISDAATIAGGEGTLLANRYRIVKQLGQGGMGSVWLVEDTQLDNKQFAIKMLPSILVSNKRAYRQLKDEALVAMKLVHPNIVQIRAFEENSGNPFLVMDYIDGKTLDDYLYEKCKAESVKCKVGGGLSEDDVIRLLKPIADALDYAHSKGVVHRDVKPSNVMIDSAGRAHVLDFGIAREAKETLVRISGKNSCGTLMYMSPEQVNGASPSREQDVYSFAAMVYECLRGEPPFCRGQIEYQILNNQPPPLPLGCSLSEFVMAGLSKDPSDRPEACISVLGFAAAEGTDVRAGAMPMVNIYGGNDVTKPGDGDEPFAEEDKRNVEALLAKLAKRSSLPSWLDVHGLYDMSQSAAAAVIDRVAREWMREACRRGVKRYMPLFTRNDWSRWSIRAQNGEITSRIGVAIFEFVRDDDILSKAR